MNRQSRNVGGSNEESDKEVSGMVRNLLLVLVLSVAMIFTACAKKETTPIVEEVEPAEEVAPLEEIEEEPEEIIEVEEAEPIVLEDIFFDYDKFNIKKEYKEVLTKNAELLLANPKAPVFDIVAVQYLAEQLARGTNDSWS